MVKVWRWLKRWWWTILVGAATVAGFVFWLLMPKPRDTKPGTPPPKTFKDRAKDEVERVRLEGEVEKARVTARAEVEGEHLDQIEEVGKEDPAEARRQLAAWIRNSL